MASTIISPSAKQKKDDDEGTDDDTQAKKYRSRNWMGIDFINLSRWLLRLRNEPWQLTTLHLYAFLVFLITSFWLLYGCKIRGNCQAGVVETSSISADSNLIKPFAEAAIKNKNYSDPFSKKLPKELLRALQSPWSQKSIPVVHFYQRSGSLPCQKQHYIYRNLKNARKLNSVVYFIGPLECAAMAKELGVILEPYSLYQDVTVWFAENIGKPIGYQVRWFVLRAFMERHALARVFYTDSDVALYANVTEVVSMFFARTHLALAVRWPSLRPPLSPSQYVSTAVSGHVSLWSYDALVDFNNFFRLFFKNAVLFGRPGDKSLVEKRAYNDMVPLGWYTHKICWTRNPMDLHPQCIADKESGVTPERSALLRDQFTPKYKVESLCKPRWCNATKWVDEGWCAFDNNFSIQTPSQFFKYQPKKGMKCPTSMHYTHFQDWAENEGEKQKTPVQFMGVHFQAHKKGYLSRGDDPAKTWGSSQD